MNTASTAFESALVALDQLASEPAEIMPFPVQKNPMAQIIAADLMIVVDSIIARRDIRRCDCRLP